MDYRKFLGKVESAVLPYFGGGTVDAPSRRLRLAAPVTPGWWRFEIQGRTATAREPAGPEGLDALPLVRGHAWGARLVREGAVAEALQLPPEEEPPRFSPVRARRWHDGSLVFEGLDFECEAEGHVRLALEEAGTLAGVKAVPASLRAAFGYTVLEAASRALRVRFSPVRARRWHDGSLLFDGLDFEGEAEGSARLVLEEAGTLASVKAVPASLRAAFGYTVLEAASRALHVRFSPVEVRSRVLEVAERGRAMAEEVLRHLMAEREAHVRALEAQRVAQEARLQGEVERARVRAEVARRPAVQPPRRVEREVGDRVERVLAHAGARLVDQRRIGNRQLEVTFRFMGERFISLVDVNTLQVMDAGICLAGADREVTLESLPSVIREAIDTDRLVITRYDD